MRRNVFEFICGNEYWITKDNQQTHYRQDLDCRSCCQNWISEKIYFLIVILDFDKKIYIKGMNLFYEHIIYHISKLSENIIYIIYLINGALRVNVGQIQNLKKKLSADT